MTSTQILVIGRHEHILQTVLRLINQRPSWEATGALDDEQAIELFHRQHFDLVLIGGGVDAISERKLRKLFSLLQPEAIVIQHFGGGGGLLENEILAALQQQRGNDYRIIDHPFSAN